MLACIATALTFGFAARAAPPPGMPFAAGAPAERLHVVGPPLTALAAKIRDPSWLVAFLVGPSRLRPGTAMPDFGLTAHEAEALARFLFPGQAPEERERPWQGGDAALGERLFVNRGCRGCHAISLDEFSVSSRVPNLAGVGLKVRGDWLFAWLEKPRAYSPRTMMPRIPLSENEIRHLVAFLLSKREGADVVSAAPSFDRAADPAEGRKLFEMFECGKCHQAPGLPAPEPELEIAPGDSTEVVLRNGRLLVEHFNCRGCHEIEGSGGRIARYAEMRPLRLPVREDDGARVKPAEIAEFLRDPTVLRPALEIRMPDYGLSEGEADAIAKYLAALDRVNGSGRAARSSDPTPRALTAGSACPARRPGSAGSGRKTLLLRHCGT